MLRLEWSQIYLCPKVLEIHTHHEQHYQESIEFIKQQTALFYLQTEDMDWTTYDNLTGYDLWHCRLGQVPTATLSKRSNTQSGWRTSFVKQVRPELSVVHAREQYHKNLSWIDGAGLAPLGQGTHGFVFIHYIN